MLTMQPALTLQNSQARLAYGRLENDLASGVFRSEADLLRAIDAAWQTILMDWDQPSLVVVPFRAGTLPLQDTLVTPYSQIQDDLTRLFTQWQTLRARLRESFNSQRVTVAGLDNLIGQIQSKTTHFQLATSDSENAFVWVSDSFTSRLHVNDSLTTAFIDTTVGIMTLQVTQLDNLDSAISGFTVDKQTSVGIPGNNLVIADAGAASQPDANPEPQPHLESDTDPHSNLTYLFDNNPSTWFEWESAYLPRQQKCRKIRSAYVSDVAGGQTLDILNVTGNQGWGWKRYIAWPGETDWDRGPDGNGYWLAKFDAPAPARFVFTITLGAPTILSLITLTPQILGGTYPRVRSISVSVDGGIWETIATDVDLSVKLNEGLTGSRLGAPEGNYAGQGLWVVPTKVPLQFIRFDMEATDSYVPELGFGHHYYVKFTQETSTNSGFFGIGASSHTSVVDTREPNPEQGLITAPPAQGVDAKGLLTNIGAIAGSFIPGVGTLVGGLVGSVLGSIVDGIFSTKHTSTTLSSEDHYDIFTGARYAIGIRDITLSRRAYAASSQCVSRQYTFARPITALSLLATEDIPASWDTATTWILYEVSTDGQSWTPIVPQNRSQGVGDVVAFPGATSVFVRITLTRPEDSPEETPIVRSYALKGLPQ